MKSLSPISSFGFLAGVALSAALAVGCGTNDDNSIVITFDAGGQDATIDVFDAGADVAPDVGIDSGCPNSTSCGGKCVETASDPKNCGGCGIACVGGKVCSNGNCAVGCGVGITACSGACVDTSNDAMNCGGCGKACTDGMVCSDGVCAITCNGGTKACGTSCIDQSSDPNNCGGCGTTCTAGQVCANGACGTTCTTGLTRCALAGGAPTGGDGGVGVDAGLMDDGGTPIGSSDAGPMLASDICTDVTSDPINCGGCGVVCPSGQLCTNGSCAVSCIGGLVQCGSHCVDPTSNNFFCGATLGCGNGDAGSAGQVCATGQVCTGGPNGTGVCATTCAANEVNCGGTCIDPTTDRNACGASGDCSNVGTGNSSGAKCVAGEACTPAGCKVSCLAGEVNCGGTCVDPKTNGNFCGAAGTCDGSTGNSGGTACVAGKVCSNGACVPNCAQGQVNCGGTCIDPQTNGSFCGATGTCVSGTSGNSVGQKCVGGTLCSGATCQTTCQAGQVNCGGTCVDPNTNGNACGAKGNCTNIGSGNSSGVICGVGTVCTSTGCQLACEAGFLNCKGTCVDPTANNAFCGATADCEGANSGIVCADGTSCAGPSPGSCQNNCSATQMACGNVCVDIKNDPAHCGSCSACAINSNVATNVCRSGLCNVSTCGSGFLDCDGTFSNGCEVSKLDDANNCGGCGHVCGASTPICKAGVCTPASMCGDGIVQTANGEEYDPPPGPFSSVSVNATTCRWDFSGVQQLYCNGTCSWAGTGGCSQGDADIFCKLKTGDALSTATSYAIVAALNAPGFPCGPLGIGTSIGPLPDRGVSRNVYYQDSSILANHGPGDVIIDVVCTTP